MALFRSYDKYVLVDGSMRKALVCGTALGYQFQIRYPSYRGTFLSCIEKLAFECDGQPVDPEQVTLLLNGKQFLLGQLSECVKEYWETLVPMTVQVLDGNDSAGEHRLRVHMEHRIPYTGYGGHCLVMTSECAKTMRVE